MDEDDDPLLGRRLETSERYDTLQSSAKRALSQSSGGDRPASIPGFALPEEWLLPPNNSVGAALLRHMGWKDGQGIGQRVRKKKIAVSSTVTSTGNEHNNEAEEIVYVPPRNSIDFQKAFPKPKVDRYGAGFDPYVDAPEFSRYKQLQNGRAESGNGGHRQIVTFADAMKPTIGSYHAVTGYGLGALEENDDLDVYGTTSMGEFDTEIGPPRISNGQEKKLLKNASEDEEAKKRKRSRQVCSDGRKPLPGFEIASLSEAPPKAVADRLKVPADFNAIHKFDEDDTDTDIVSALYRQHNFSASKQSTPVTVKQRAALLEGTTEPGDAVNPLQSTGSVFDLLGSAARQKLMDAASRAKSASMPKTDREVAQLQTSSSNALTVQRNPLVQGQLQAKISASIAKRFVSSAIEGGGTAETKTEDLSTPFVTVPMKKKSHRSQRTWIPSALLCKRFHVKCAGVTSRSGEIVEDGKSDLFAQELVPHLVEYAAVRKSHDDNTAAVVTARPLVKQSHLEPEELPPLPDVERPTANLLRSIFEPSDESTDEEETEDEKSENEREHDDNAKRMAIASNESRLGPAGNLSRRAAADYFSSDSSDDGREQNTNSDQIMPLQQSNRRLQLQQGGSQSDSGSDSDGEPNRKRRRRDHDEGLSDNEMRKKKKRPKKHKKDKHKKHKKDKGSKKDKKHSHHESSRDSRKRSRSRSPPRSSRRSFLSR